MREFAKMLSGKNCLITGATGGIGKNIAMKMVESGCNLFLTSTNDVKLKKLQSRLHGIAGRKIRTTYESGDLNILGDVENIIYEAKRAFGSIDILINCAGVFAIKLLEASHVEDFEACFNVNVRAPFLLARAFAQDMKKNKWGRIVNIGSSSAYSGFKETSIYCASKHAILGLSRSLHDELKKYNIRVFCVSPGAVKTRMGKKIKNQNFKTFLDAKEVAEYVSFIISFNEAMVSEEIRLNRIKVE